MEEEIHKAEVVPAILADVPAILADVPAILADVPGITEAVMELEAIVPVLRADTEHLMLEEQNALICGVRNAAR